MIEGNQAGNREVLEWDGLRHERGEQQCLDQAVVVHEGACEFRAFGEVDVRPTEQGGGG